MLENVLESISEHIFHFITGESKTKRSLLVKKHSENLQTHGDFSFPNTLKSWHEYLDSTSSKNADDATVMSYIGKEVTDIVHQSKEWVLEVKQANIIKDRAYLFLERSKAIPLGLIEAMNNYEVITRHMLEGTSRVLCDPDYQNKDCITTLRIKYLCKVIQNLCAVDFKCRDIAPSIIVTTRFSKNSIDRTVLCGAVLNSKTGLKETMLSADEFVRMRQEEMTLIAQHKYGVRVSTDQKWKKFIAHLGESAAAFELLQIKPNSAVKINFDCSSTGSSKGAAFVLYNCARLETIIRTYNNKVSDGVYPPLPKFEDTDFTLLTQEDEWCLVFNHILGFPSVLNNCVDINEEVCEFRPHQLTGFLCSLVRVFSQYYRRIRILTEPRKHLLPVMFARIHMLKVLTAILKICLNILNIKSVSQM